MAEVGEADEVELGETAPKPVWLPLSVAGEGLGWTGGLVRVGWVLAGKEVVAGVEGLPIPRMK